MTSVFAELRDEMFETIRVRIRFEDRYCGGQPKDAKLVQGWLRKNMGVEDELELFARTRQHLIEMGVEVATDATYDDLVKASESIAAEIKTQGFKRDLDGRPVMEARTIKAGIKESVNVLFGKELWGPTRKGAKGFTAERVFPYPAKIPIGEGEDVKLDLAIGHISGPNGPRSTIGYYEYVEEVEVEFFLRQLISQNAKNGGEPALDYDRWSRIWTHMELNGLGAMRSQGFGQFVVTAFEILDADAVRGLETVA